MKACTWNILAMYYAKERLTKYKNVLCRYLAIRTLNIPSFQRQIILDLLWIYANSERNYGFTLRVVFEDCAKNGEGNWHNFQI